CGGPPCRNSRTTDLSLTSLFAEAARAREASRSGRPRPARPSAPTERKARRVEARAGWVGAGGRTVSKTASPQKEGRGGQAQGVGWSASHMMRCRPGLCQRKVGRPFPPCPEEAEEGPCIGRAASLAVPEPLARTSRSLTVIHCLRWSLNVTELGCAFVAGS